MNERPRKRNEQWRTRALTVSARERRLQRLRVEVVDGPDAGMEKMSAGDELAIGTAAGNDLVLTDGAVSRHHCAVAVDARGFLLRDLGSTNGTTLAGYRVREAYLETGAVVVVGETALRFDAMDEDIVEPLAKEHHFGEALGESPAMRRIFAVLARVAPTDATVLLEGETGTGKGVLAEALHGRSLRAAGPFVVLDCAAIPPSLAESELFGHERGAFTGAERARPGVFESARGGTVFLDEVGELSPELQPKLLRALDGRVVSRVGSIRSIPLDVRVIAATNRDLRAEVNRGAFRADLFYRLSTLRISVPPLRQRPEDVPALTARFYAALAPENDPDPPAELLAAVMRHAWPGNVRELRSYVERAVLLGSGLDAPQGDGPYDLTVSFRDAKQVAIARWEQGYVEHLVRVFGGNLSRAAREVHMDRNHLRDLLRRHGRKSRP